MNIYIVVKEGIYRHDIFGAFDQEKTAIEMAKILASSDIDDYHQYAVIMLPLNRLLTTVMNGVPGHTTDEDSPIFRVRKLAAS